MVTQFNLCNCLGAPPKTGLEKPLSAVQCTVGSVREREGTEGIFEIPKSLVSQLVSQSISPSVRSSVSQSNPKAKSGLSLAARRPSGLVCLVVRGREVFESVFQDELV